MLFFIYFKLCKKNILKNVYSFLNNECYLMKESPPLYCIMYYIYIMHYACTVVKRHRKVYNILNYYERVTVY